MSNVFSSIKEFSCKKLNSRRSKVLKWSLSHVSIKENEEAAYIRLENDGFSQILNYLGGLARAIHI